MIESSYPKRISLSSWPDQDAEDNIPQLDAWLEASLEALFIAEFDGGYSIAETGKVHHIQAQIQAEIEWMGDAKGMNAIVTDPSFIDD